MARVLLLYSRMSEATVASTGTFVPGFKVGVGKTIAR